MDDPFTVLSSVASMPSSRRSLPSKRSFLQYILHCRHCCCTCACCCCSCWPCATPSTSAQASPSITHTVARFATSSLAAFMCGCAGGRCERAASRPSATAARSRTRWRRWTVRRRRAEGARRRRGRLLRTGGAPLRGVTLPPLHPRGRACIFGSPNNIQCACDECASACDVHVLIYF